MIIDPDIIQEVRRERLVNSPSLHARLEYIEHYELGVAAYAASLLTRVRNKLRRLQENGSIPAHVVDQTFNNILHDRGTSVLSSDEKE